MAQKPVITATDSGGPLEFVHNELNGLVVDPQPEALAAALDQLHRDRQGSREMGRRGRESLLARDISWANVVERLLA